MNSTISIQELKNADRAIRQIQKNLNHHFNANMSNLGVLKLVLQHYGIIINRKSQPLTIRYAHLIERGNTGFIGHKTWPLEKAHDFFRSNLTYEQLLAASDYIGYMCRGIFKNSNLIAFSRNKLQILLEGETYYSMRIIYEIGVRKTAVGDWRNAYVAQFEYYSYVRLIRIYSHVKQSVNRQKIINKAFVNWNKKQYNFSPQQLISIQKEASDQYYQTNFFDFTTIDITDIEIGKFLDKTLIKPQRYRPLRINGNTYVYYQHNRDWELNVEGFQYKKPNQRDLLNAHCPIIARYKFDDDETFYVNAKLFTSLLQKIPNFKVKLTEQQLKVIGLPGNVVLIGRSGTGKTTTSILRLFALETVYRIKKLKKTDKQAKVKAEHLDQTVGLRSIFATASPVLTNEIYRYYKGLNSQIKDELLKKQQCDKIRKEDQAQVISQQDYLKKQLQGISLEKPVQSLENVKEIIESEGLEHQIQNIADKYNSLSQVKDEEFPLFVSIKQLILMIDSCLPRPFFYRSTLSQGVGEKTSGWYSEEKGVMIIDDYYKKVKAEIGAEDWNHQQEDDQQQQYHQQSSSYRYLNKLRGKQKTFEIQYEYFRDNFWDFVKSQFYYKKITSHLVWTEIYSVIKGGSNSGLSGLSRDNYMKRYNPTLSLDQKEAIFNCFVLYKKWKDIVGAYDLMDVVNYGIEQLTLSPFCSRIPDIHYIMIDEVQDLCGATIRLLTKIATNNIFCSGDSAQSIAKGVGFRYGSLQQILDLSEGSFKGGFRQLTINFRSQNNILQLAHSVIEIIENLFPQTIDKLQKESSPVDGPKPLVVCQQNIEILYSYTINADSATSKGLNKLEFGCDQVVIVRNQESKKDIPSFLRYALALTIQQCKGLEFNDVILFNFFKESTANWSILHELRTQQGKIVSDPEKQKRQLNSLHSQLCSDLKLLYTAITRPKKSLIIFDTDEVARKQIVRLWNQLDFIQLPSAKFSDQLKEFTTKSSPEAWIRQGYRMMSKQLYEQALSCFIYGNNKEMITVCEAYLLADKAVDLSKTLKKENIPMKSKPKVSKKKLKQMRKQAEQTFICSAQKFQSVGRFKEAAKCFFSGKQYLKAKILFEKLNLLEDVAQCYFMLQDYRKAAQIYQRLKNYPKQIECLDLAEDWEAILAVMAENRNNFQQEERNSIVSKYCNLAYGKLMKEIQTDFIQKEEVQEKKEDNTEKMQAKDRIDQQDEDSDDQGESQNQFQDRKRQAAETILVIDEQQAPIDASLAETLIPVGQMSISEVQELKEQNSHPNQQIIQEQVQQLKYNASQVQELLPSQNDKSSSFADLNESMRLKQFSAKNSSVIQLHEPDLESIKSFSDPNDEFLGSSLSQIRKDTFSEYSMIGETKGMRTNMIKTKGNIFLQDDVMKRLVNIISAASSQLSKYIKTLRANKTLLSVNPKKDTLKIECDEDFEEISAETIELILDTLQSFGYYKMCIFVCNRYNMPQRLGRYLVSIASQYSVISNNCMRVTFSLVQPSQIRKNLQEKAIIASVAVHNAFEIINPQFFNLRENYENFLGKRCANGLIYLGMYKKAVFMMGIDNCLHLLRLMFDTDMYAEIFLDKVRKTKKFQINQKHPPIFYCQQTPTSTKEEDFSIFAMEKQLFLLMTSNSYTHFISQNIINQTLKADKGNVPNIVPKYFKQLKGFWQNRHSIDYFRDFLKKLSTFRIQTLNKIDQYDTITASLLVLSTLSKNEELCSQILLSLTTSSPHEVFSSILSFYRRLRSLLSKSHYSPSEAYVADCVLSLYGVKLIDSDCLTQLGDSVALLRGSSVADKCISAKNKRNLYFIEQGLRVMAGERRFCLDMAVEKINHLLSRFAKYTGQVLADWKITAPAITRKDVKQIQGVKLVMDYLKNIFRQEERTSKKKLFKINKSSKATVSMTRSMFEADSVFYNEEPEIDSSSQQDKQSLLQQSLICELQNISPLIRNFILQRYHREEKAHYYMFNQVGLNKVFHQISKNTIMDNLFQAIEFRRFGLLDDYTHHLDQSLNELPKNIALQLLYEVVVLLTIRIIVTEKKTAKDNIKILVPYKLLRHFEVTNNDFEFRYSSMMGIGDLLRMVSGYIDDILSMDSNFTRCYRQAMLATAQFLFLNLSQNQTKNMEDSVVDMITTSINLCKQKYRTKIQSKLKRFKDKSEAIEVFDEQYWNVNMSVQEIEVIDKANQELNQKLANEDYQKFQLQQIRRCSAARIIKRFFKRILADRKNKQRRQRETCRDLMRHLNSEYYQRVNQSSLDVHFICQQLLKIAILKQLKQISEEEVAKITMEISNWMITQESKFKTKELKIKSVKEVKWFSRKRPGIKSKRHIDYKRIA